MKDVKDIIREAREKKRWTQEQMADKMGISRRQYNKYEAGKFPKYKTSVAEEIDRILGTKIRELIYEQDVPRESSGEEPSVSLSKTSGTDHTDSKNYLEKRRALKGKTEPFMVPLVPVKAQAGYASAFNNTTYIDKLDLYPILPGIDPRGAVWRYFEVQGDSMEPRLFEKDFVLVSMVPYEDWHTIKSGEIFVVVTEDEVLIKKVVLKTQDTWILESLNKRHKQKPMPVSDIKELWYYRRKITK